MTPVLLIPGMMCDARMWGGLPAALAPHQVGHFLPIAAHSMAELAAQALAQAPPRFSLAGLSMGGIVAMEILAQAPGRVERLALLDTNPLAEAPRVRARRRSQIARTLTGGLVRVMREEMKPNYLAQGSDQGAVLDLCLDMALALGPEVFARQSRALAGRSDRQAALAAFRGPALVLTGAEDRLCPLDRHELMHALMPQSRLVIVPGAGHLPPLERPLATAEAMRLWLSE